MDIESWEIVEIIRYLINYANHVVSMNFEMSRTVCQPIETRRRSEWHAHPSLPNWIGILEKQNKKQLTAQWINSNFFRLDIQLVVSLSHCLLYNEYITSQPHFLLLLSKLSYVNKSSRKEHTAYDSPFFSDSSFSWFFVQISCELEKKQYRKKWNF